MDKIMTQNIEQRTLNAVAQYENASKTAIELTNFDGDVETEAGLKKSFLKIAREQEQLFQNRFSLISPVNWQPEQLITNPLQVYNAEINATERTYLANPLKIPFVTSSSSFEHDLSLNLWLIEDLATSSMITSGASQILAGAIYPKNLTSSAKNGDIVDELTRFLRLDSIDINNLTLLELKPEISNSKISGVISELKLTKPYRCKVGNTKCWLGNVNAKALDFFISEQSTLNIPSPTFDGDLTPFLPSPARQGVSIYKSCKKYSYSLNVGLLIGGAGRIRYVANKDYGIGDGTSLATAMSMTSLNAQIKSGLLNNVGSLYIYLLDEFFDRSHSLDSLNMPGTRIYVESLCENGSWLTTAESQITWSSASYAVYSGAVPNFNYAITQVFHLDDVDEDGLPIMYEPVHTMPTTPKTWHQDTSTGVITVQCENDIGTSRLVALRHIDKYSMPESEAVCFKNVNFALGGQLGLKFTRSSHNPIVLAQCKLFGGIGNSLAVTGDKSFTYVLDCVGAWAGRDGYGYNNNSRTGLDSAVAIEVNCKYKNAGKYKYLGGNTTTQSNNASTAHDGMTVWRFCGDYYDCEGPVVADAQGCQSFNYHNKIGDVLQSNTGVKSSYFAYSDDAPIYAKPVSVLVGNDFSGTNTEFDIVIKKTDLHHAKNSADIKKVEILTYEQDIKICEVK